MKRYEQSIRVITAFFAVLLGFGLKNLLDPKTFEPQNARWPCFLISVFLFLRFLLGSSNHLWFEFVRPDLKEENKFQVSRFRVLKDFVFLVIFGLIGVVICYSTTVEQFLERNLLLAGIALIWVFFYAGIDYINNVPRGKWGYWGWINLAQLLSILVVEYLVIPNKWGTIPFWPSWFLGPAWDWSLSILVVAYVLIFALDFLKQLQILGETS